VLRALLISSTLACAGPLPAPGPADPSPAAIGNAPDWRQLPDADALRAEYGARTDFAERCELGRPLREAFELLAAESWPELLEMSAGFLTRCPVDIDFHLLQALALQNLGRADEAALHGDWRRALVESVLRSGSGDSAESPWITISVAEEYALLRALGMMRESQALLGGGVDMITVTEDGATRRVFFFPKAHWERMAREFPE
jgi:hypothetical protein